MTPSATERVPRHAGRRRSTPGRHVGQWWHPDDAPAAPSAGIAEAAVPDPGVTGADVTPDPTATTPATDPAPTQAPPTPAPDADRRPDGDHAGGAACRR